MITSGDSIISSELRDGDRNKKMSLSLKKYFLTVVYLQLPMDMQEHLRRFS